MNIYLVSTEGYHLLKEELKNIIKSNNYITFNMNKTTIKEILDEASYLSLDDALKYLVINNADFFGSAKITDDEADALIRYINNPNPKTVLIFTTLNGIDSRKKIVKEIKSKGTIINKPKMDKRSLNIYLTNYLKSNGYNIDYQTINYVMDNSYSNIDIMINELDKIMMYYNKPCSIKYDDVINIVGEELDSNNFHFVNAVIDKDLGSALKILSSLKVYKVEATALVILLAREYRLMYYVKNLYNKKSLNEIMSYLGLADWQVNKLFTNSNHFTNEELLDNLVSLCNIDLNIKKGIWDKDIAIYGFLLEACS